MAVKPPPPLVILRSVEMNGSIWFFASDVCATLGIPKTKPERLSPSMMGTAKDETGRATRVINAEGLLCLMGIRELGRRNRSPEFLLGSVMYDQEGQSLHDTAPLSWHVVQGAKEALQAVNLAWPAAPTTAPSD